MTPGDGMTRDTRTPEEAPLDLDGLWQKADLQRWAEGEDPPWDYYPDALLTSAYADYIRALNPSTVLRLIDLARLGEQARRLLEAGPHPTPLNDSWAEAWDALQTLAAKLREADR